MTADLACDLGHFLLHGFGLAAQRALAAVPAALGRLGDRRRRLARLVTSELCGTVIVVEVRSLGKLAVSHRGETTGGKLAGHLATAGVGTDIGYVCVLSDFDCGSAPL